MKISIAANPIELVLKEKFTISRDAYQKRSALIIALSANGKTGYGEATSHPYYQVDRDAMIIRLDALKPKIESYDFKMPVTFWSFLEEDLLDMPFLQAAIDCAAYDLYGKLLGKPCTQIWGLANKPSPKSSYTIGLGPIEEMQQKAKDASFDILKIKLGRADDLEIIQALRDVTKATFRVDANGAWNAAKTIELALKFKHLGVELIEQPLPANDWVGMQKVVKQCVLPVFADETCVRESDVKRCEPYFQGITLKLMKCGGITPALRMIAQARKAGLATMGGCMIETSVGISAIGQLGPALDHLDIDGALFLTKDPAKGVSLTEQGAVVHASLPGLGIQWLGV